MFGAAFVVESTVGEEAALLKADSWCLGIPSSDTPHQTAQCQGVGVDPGVLRGSVSLQGVTSLLCDLRRFYLPDFQRPH